MEQTWKDSPETPGNGPEAEVPRQDKALLVGRRRPPIEPATLPLWPDVGRRLGIGRAATYEAAKRKEIPTIRIGRKILVPKAALERMLA
jgi:excisionase family DNA binding protein